MMARLVTVPLCAVVFSVGLARAAEPPPSGPVPLAPAAEAPSREPAPPESSGAPASPPLAPPSEPLSPTPPIEAEKSPPPPLRVPAGPRDEASTARVATAPTVDTGVPENRAKDAVAPRLALSLGIRTLFVLDDGYQPFAERGVLWGAALGGSARAYEDRDLALLVGLLWDIAFSESRARGAETGLAFQRLTAVPEVRYRLAPRLIAYGRAGIGAGYVRATYQDAVIAGERADDAFLFTADAGGGLALHLGRKPGGQGVWLSLDGGYLWTSSANLALGSDDAPARAEPLRMGQLSLHGPYTKLNATLGF